MDLDQLLLRQMEDPFPSFPKWAATTTMMMVAVAAVVAVVMANKYINSF
jgi:hypothetical protein